MLEKRRESKYGGITGKILRVDLSNETIEIDEYKEEYLRKFIGQDGFAVKILYNEVFPSIAPLDPENRLVISVGPLAGTSVQAACNYSVAWKSPVTGFTIYNAHANGFFGARLKFSGYDGIIIKGKAKQPVYLWIHDEKAEIRDASKLWGKNTHETEDMLKKELRQKDLSCSCIGPAGENLVLTAAVINDKTHVAARGGGGAVMGSKNLKAIVVNGSKKPPIADEERFKELSREWRKKNMEHSFTQQLAKYGTGFIFDKVYQTGDLPIKNFSTGVLEGCEKLSGQYMVDNMFVRHTSCWGCSIAHTKLLRLKDGAFAGEECKIAEYEIAAAMGSNLGITDPTVACKGNEILNKYGLDGLATSNAIGFAMECYEKGLISKQDTDGIDLRFGNYEAAFEMIDKIVKREGLGDILADGPVTAAKYIGKGSEKFVAHVKNMPIVMHDFRAFWGTALSYTVATTGPAHEGSTLFREMYGEIPQFSVEGKVKATMEAQALRSFHNTLGICHFSIFGVPIELQAETLSACTGMKFTPQDARKVGLRITNLRRAFSVRHGLVPSDDTLSYRLLEPPPNGGAKGSIVPIEAMVSDYYELMGWDRKSGKPYIRTLEELDLGDVAKDLWG